MSTDFELDAQPAAAAGLDTSYVVVAPSQLADFHKRLARLNAKAERFGLTPIAILDQKEAIYERVQERVGRDHETLLTRLIRLPEGAVPKAPVLLHRIKLEYPIIKLGNWQVIGRLENLAGQNLLFSITANLDDQAAIRQAALHPINCEHCKAKRRRKESYVLRDQDSGAHLQVGSSCLEDFTGVDPGTALFLADLSHTVRVWEGELDEFARSGSVNAIATREFLAQVSFLSARGGFVSAQKAREQGCAATFEDAAGLHFALRDDADLMSRWQAEYERHIAVADAVRIRYERLIPETDFDRNVKLLLAQDALSLDRRHLAFAAAAVAQVARQIAKESRPDRESEHVGVAGEKRSAILTIARVLQFPSRFHSGADYVLLMNDEHGNQIKWSTSSPGLDLAEGEGRRMEAAFKVKGHDEYKGVSQTLVTHLKVLAWMEPEQAKESIHCSPPPVNSTTAQAMASAISKVVSVDWATLTERIGKFVFTTTDEWSAQHGAAADWMSTEQPPQLGAAAYNSRDDVHYFFADRVEPGQEAAVFLREVVGRHGRGALPEGRLEALGEMLRSWGTSTPGTTERQIFDASYAHLGRCSEEGLVAIALDSAIGLGVEPSTTRSGGAEAWLQSAYEAMRQVLDELVGCSDHRLQAPELIELAYALAQRVRQPLPPSPASCIQAPGVDEDIALPIAPDARCADSDLANG